MDRSLGSAIRSINDKNDILMLKESFSQLSKLEEECNQELSNFQRENFIAHEEFRAVVSHLNESIDQFGVSINQQLDKLQLKINHLEIIAMHAYPIKSETHISLPNAQFIARSPKYIYLTDGEGNIRAYNPNTYAQVKMVKKTNYDPLENFGKITVFQFFKKLYVGFSSGLVIAFNEEIENPQQMQYMTTPVTCIFQSEDLVYTGSHNGIIVIWSAETLERLIICPVHKMAIASIFRDGPDIIVATRTGVITRNDRLCTKQTDRIQVGHSLHSLMPFKEHQYVFLSDNLLVLEGHHVLKTFDAVEIGASPICCMKQPELLLLGTKSSTELKLIFLDSLLFPKSVNVLDSPPMSMLHYGSQFYVVTKNGSVFIIRPGN